MVVLDLTVMSIALPSAQRALHFIIADRQWVVAAYTRRSAACCCPAADWPTCSAARSRSRPAGWARRRLGYRRRLSHRGTPAHRGEPEGKEFPHVPKDDPGVRVAVEDAAEDQPHRMAAGPWGPTSHRGIHRRVSLHDLPVVGPDGVGVDVERDVKVLQGFPERGVLRLVQVMAQRVIVD